MGDVGVSICRVCMNAVDIFVRLGANLGFQRPITASA